MTTPMEHRNNQLIAEFLTGKEASLLWASRVSGLGLDDMIRECLRMGWDKFTAEMQYLEGDENEPAKKVETDIEREFSALKGVV